jgi:hypothetical protein
MMGGRPVKRHYGLTPHSLATLDVTSKPSASLAQAS